MSMAISSELVILSQCFAEKDQKNAMKAFLKKKSQKK